MNSVYSQKLKKTKQGVSPCVYTGFPRLHKNDPC